MRFVPLDWWHLDIRKEAAWATVFKMDISFDSALVMAYEWTLYSIIICRAYVLITSIKRRRIVWVQLFEYLCVLPSAQVFSTRV